MKKCNIFIVFFLISLLFSTSLSYDYHVGGKDGWILNPSQNYSDWTEKKRFQVHDDLVFNCQRKNESVMVVNKVQYLSCNTSNPIETRIGDHTVFYLERSGDFYFISGEKQHCDLGQKLAITVMAVRTKEHTLTSSSSVPAPAPAPLVVPAATPASAHDNYPYHTASQTLGTVPSPSPVALSHAPPTTITSPAPVSLSPAPQSAAMAHPPAKSDAAFSVPVDGLWLLMVLVLLGSGVFLGPVGDALFL